MKRILFLLTMSLSVFLAKAQKYDEIKTKLTLGKYADAKADIDKAMANAKFTSKAEAYMLKASIYGALAMDDDKKGTAVGDQLVAEADLAFKKYKEMEPDLTLVDDLIYKNGPTNIYYSYYTSGYSDYDTANKLEKKKKLLFMG